jgi:hypothetical protein
MEEYLEGWSELPRKPEEPKAAAGAKVQLSVPGKGLIELSQLDQEQARRRRRTIYLIESLLSKSS